MLIFCFIVYTASAGLAWLVTIKPTWAEAVLTPLLPTLCATAAFWRRQTYKFRAKDWQVKLRIWREALDTLGHEVVNSANAIRANLIAFRLANPGANSTEHLYVIEDNAVRMGDVIRKVQDPVAWHAARKKKKAEGAPPASVGEDARSRIAL